MKLDPVSFLNYASENGLYTITIQVNCVLEDHVKELFTDELRTINALDPLFAYTCRCNDIYIVWEFAYQNKEIMDEANLLINKFMKDVEKNTEGTEVTTECSIFDTFYAPDLNQGCACPFEKSKDEN